MAIYRQSIGPQMKPPEKSISPRDHLLKNSAKISVLNAVGYLSALIVDIFIAAKFGLGRVTDAFFIALTVPQLITSVIWVSSNVALVPIFSDVVQIKNKQNLWRLVSNLINISLLSLGIIGILGSLVSSWVIRILGAGLEVDFSAMASSYSVLLFLMVVPVGAGEIIKAALNCLDVFDFPAATSFLRNTIIIITIALFADSLEIYALVYGYLLSFWFEFLFLGAVLLTHGYRYRPVINFSHPQVKAVFQRLKLPLSGSLIGQSNILLERFFSSFLPAGIVSALTYARRFLRAIDSIFLTSIPTVLLPKMARESNANQHGQFTKLINFGVKIAVGISIPVMFGIISLDVPFIRVLLQRGEFGREATEITARLLRIYLIGAPATAVYRIFTTSFFAMGDTMRPFRFQVILLTFNAVLNAGLFFLFGAAGLPLGLSLSRILVTIYAGRVLSRRYRHWRESLVLFTAKVFISGMAILVSITIIQQILSMLLMGINMRADFLLLFIGALIGLFVYLGMLRLFRVEEIGHFLSLVGLRSLWRSGPSKPI